MKFSTVLTGAVIASVTSGHTIFVQLEASGKTYGQYLQEPDVATWLTNPDVSYAIRTPTYDGVRTLYL